MFEYVKEYLIPDLSNIVCKFAEYEKGDDIDYKYVGHGPKLYGVKCGEWKYFEKDGRIIHEGTYSNNMKSGVWRENDNKNGLYCVGKYENDCKIGTWNHYYADGKLYGTYLHGIPKFSDLFNSSIRKFVG